MLTIVVTGRNDDYGRDFRERFFRTVRFNLRELSDRGVDHEYVLVEWAPEPDRPLLADVILDEIPDLRESSFTAYIVDRQYHDAFSLNPRLKYLEYVAKNVGIRRAKGRFVLSTNSDVYLGRQVLTVLQRGNLKPGTIYRAERYDLKQGAESSNITWEVLEDPRNLAGPPRGLRFPLRQGGTGDFVLLDRETFHQLRGFNEVYRLARMGVDHNFLVKAFSTGVEITDIGGPVYHVNHVGSYRVSRQDYAGREAEAPWGDPRWRYQGVVYENPPGWGLADAPMKDLGLGRWMLEFAWDVVPPMVDLSRVVLPVDRVGRPQPRRYVAKK